MRTIIATLLLLLSNALYAAVSAEVDRMQVGEGESLTLTISTENSQTNQPDLSILEANFDLVSTSNSKNISIINGKMSSQISWQIQLIPKQIGTIIIPPITMGNDKTQPITIEVTKQASASNPSGNNNSNKASENAFFETTVDKHEVYVQEQIIYTQRFYYREDLPIADISADDLSVDGASVEDLNTKGPHYQQTINGVQYQVIEATYAIFPEKSGQLHIPARTLTVRLQSSMFAPPRIARLHSDENIINVLPQPNHDTPWLPAKNFSIKDSWSSNPPTFKVGESVTRKIMTEAQGLNQSQLPALSDIKIDGLKIYTDKPEAKNTVTLNGIVGARTDSMAIVATKPGTYTLPEIAIKWWDTKTNQASVASIPAYTFTVTDASPNSQTALPAPNIDQNLIQPTHSPSATQIHTEFKNQLWLYIAATSITLWLLTLLLWWRSTRRSQKPISASTTTTKEKSTAMVDLTNACQNKDAAKARDALLKWAQERWRSPIITLDDIAAKAPSLSHEIADLERALYAKHSIEWQGTTLLTLVKQLPEKDIHATSTKSPLESLYPS